MKIEFQPAFVLHSRPFTDSKRLVDLFTRDFGRVRVVARVSRGKSAARSLPQYTSLLVSWMGKGELKTLTHFEVDGQAPRFALQGSGLFCGFYLNELLLRVLAEGDANDAAYAAYLTALARLTALAGAETSAFEPSLREFELALLAALGYGVDWQRDVSGVKVVAEGWYRCDPQQGFVPTLMQDRDGFSGKNLLAIADRDFSQVETLQGAKRLTRRLLKPLLGDKPLKARDLFR